MENRVERRLAAILAADIVGYSRLIGADEAGTLAEIKELRAAAIDPLIAARHGRIVKLMGDGALVEFASVVDAVACAVAIQKGVAEHQSQLPPERRIAFRIGINLGDVVVEGDDLFGDGVNVAARLEQLCTRGGVLISGTAYDQLQGKLSLPLDFAGEQRVKNIARPVRAYSVRLDGAGQPWRLRLRQYSGRLPLAAAALIVLALAAGGLWWMRPVTPPDAKPSIAVLPFDNLGGDEATGRLADGITEDIITDLARYHDLEVIARNSVEVYGGNATDIRQVGKELNVRYVLEGSIQHQADSVRVSAQLIDATSGAHVWSNRWDRPAADVFAVQSELADQVAANLAGYSGTIIATDRDAAKRKRPSDLNAYDLYILGIEAKHHETKESVEQAIDLLKRSIAIDPTFARAWTGLAWAYDGEGGWSQDWNATHKLFLEAAHRAVDLDPQDAEAHAALGMALGEGADLVQSEVEFDKALSLNPSSAEILTWYAGWAVSFGKAEAGARDADQAMRLNPTPPLWARFFLRYAYFSVGRYQDAFLAQQRIPKESFTKWDYIMAASILAALGNREEASAAVAETLHAYPETSVQGWISDPGFSEPERQRFADLMRKAGFPVCASADAVRQNPNLVRLLECVQPRAVK